MKTSMLPLVLHHHLADVDELGGAIADDVHAQQLLGVGREEQLHRAVGLADDLPARVVVVGGASHLVVDAARAQIVLGGADHRDLGDGVDPERRQRRDLGLVGECRTRGTSRRAPAPSTPTRAPGCRRRRRRRRSAAPRSGSARRPGCAPWRRASRRRVRARARRCCRRAPPNRAPCRPRAACPISARRAAVRPGCARCRARRRRAGPGAPRARARCAGRRTSRRRETPSASRVPR